MSLRTIEVSESMVRNRAFVELCKKNGFKPIKFKHKPAKEAATKTGKKLKNLKIDWSKPLEFLDGTPIISVEKSDGSYIVGIFDGEWPQSVADLMPYRGTRSYGKNRVLLNRDGSYWGGIETVPIVRNAASWTYCCKGAIKLGERGKAEADSILGVKKRYGCGPHCSFVRYRRVDGKPVDCEEVGDYAG